MAAVAFDLYQPFDAGAGADVLEDRYRAQFRNVLLDGPIRGELNSFHIDVDTGRNVLLSSGRCWIQGHWGEVSADIAKPIAVNASGNPRIDRIVLRADFVNNLIEHDVLQGTPAGSPAAPALTQNTSVWEISLAQIAVANGFATLGAGTITDERRWAAGKPAGGGPGVIAAAAGRTTNLSIGDSTWTLLQLDSSEEYDTAAIHSLVTLPSRFTIPGGCDGLWGFHCATSWEYNSTHNRGLRIERNGGALRTLHLGLASDNSIAPARDGYYETNCLAGDYIEFRVWQDTGSALNITVARASARYLGSLVG